MDETENDSSVSVSKESCQEVSHYQNLNCNRYKNKDFDSISIRIPLLNQNFNNQDNRDAELRLLKTRFCQLQEEHKKLIAITSELTSALQLNILGQTRNLQRVLDHCRVIYPSLFVSQNNRQQNVSAVHKTDKQADKTGHADTTIKNEQLSRREYSESNAEVQETVDPVDRELTANVVPNLNLGNIHHENEGKLQLETEISEEEIKEMLETIFIKAIRHITEDHTNVESECCQTGRACLACRNEISKIVESILAKVVESPRFKISPRYSTSANSCNTDLQASQYQLQVSKGLSGQITDSLAPKLDKDEDEENCNEKLENASVFSNTHVSNLDYHEVKKDLLKEDNDEKIRILRALRRGLTKSNEGERQKTLEVYIRHDILNIYGKQPLMELLLQSGSLYLNEHVFRVINTIASFRQGRSYLGSNDKLIKTMLLPKFMENPASPTRDMLAAALQKLSLQKRMRTCMVDEGLLDYLIEFLDESFQKLSLYTLEHCTALLMNLMLVDDAQKYCIANADKVVKLLKKLLKEPHTAFLPYANGIMLSLLMYENINVEARKQNLDEVIHELIKDTQDEYLRRQLSFIIQLRFSKQLQSFIGDDDENPGVDVLEKELDTDSEEMMLEERNDGQTLHNEGVTKLSSNAPLTRHEQVNKRSLYHSSSTKESKLSANKKTNKPLLVISGSKKKKIVRAPKSFPRTSFCYLEICQEIHNGSRFCRCTKCIPGKSRYSCGCYEVIRKEVAEEIDSVCTGQTISTTKYVKKTFKGSSVEVVENSQENYADSQCAICGDQICNCAFESRPKIHRTPPKT